MFVHARLRCSIASCYLAHREVSVGTSLAFRLSLSNLARVQASDVRITPIK